MRADESGGACDDHARRRAEHFEQDYLSLMALNRFEVWLASTDFGVTVREFPAGTKTAPDAARAVGCDVGQIVKSLVFVADGEPILALTSGANRADPAKLAALLGVTEVRRATADEARGATGFAIGGTPPFGFPRSV